MRAGTRRLYFPGLDSLSQPAFLVEYREGDPISRMPGWTTLTWGTEWAPLTEKQSRRESLKASEGSWIRATLPSGLPDFVGDETDSLKAAVVTAREFDYYDLSDQNHQLAVTK